MTRARTGDDSPTQAAFGDHYQDRTSVIRAENLTKEYNGLKAVDGLNLSVGQGEIYGFLGPNGAGKTTTILMLLSIVKPSQGRIYLLGQQLEQANLDLRTRLGVVSEKQYLYKEMKAREYLDFFGYLYGVRDRARRIDQLLEELDLVEARNKRLGDFSRGMQQKIGFARALLHDPELLILDEPISGLDPNGVKQIRDLIARENKRGKTIFISSHLLSEVEKLCRKVGIINRGKLLAEEEMENLKRRLRNVVELEVELSKVRKEITDTLRGFHFVKKIQQDQNVLTITVNSDQDYREPISEAVSRKGGIVLGIRAKEMSLEDAFMTITQKNVSLLTSPSVKS
jgi:ABC-2 type transport system ATP-binding protein